MNGPPRLIKTADSFGLTQVLSVKAQWDTHKIAQGAQASDYLQASRSDPTNQNFMNGKRKLRRPLKTTL